MRLIQLILLVLCTSVSLVFAQATPSPYATVSYTGIYSGGVPLAAGRACFTPVMLNGTAIPAAFTSGVITKTPICSRVVSGNMIPLQLVKSTVTNPLNLAYSMTLIDGINGAQLIGPNDGYGAIQISGDMDLHTLGPNVPGIPLVGQATKGDPGASAYQVWLSSGNTGTQAQFLASLQGTNGVGVPLTDSSLRTSTSAMLIKRVNTGSNWATASDNNILFGRRATLRTFTPPQGSSYQNLFAGDRCAFAHPGWNLGGNNWFVGTCYDEQLYSWSTGIFNGHGTSAYNYRAGDFNLHGGYVQGKQAWINGSDEAGTNDRFYWQGGAYGDAELLGTMVTSVTGGTSASINCTGDCSTASVGLPLIDTSTASTLTATAVSRPDQHTALITVSGGTLVPSKCGTIAADITGVPFSAITGGTSTAITLSGLPAALNIGDYLAGGTFFFETTQIIAVQPFTAGTQTVVAPLQQNHPAGGRFCSDGASNTGVAGRFYERLDKDVVGGHPYLMRVFGAASANTLFVTEQTEQGLKPDNFDVGPVRLFAGSTITDSGNSCTYAHIETGEANDPCPFAQQSTGPVNVSLMPHPFLLAAGDHVVNAGLSSSGISARRISIQDPNPYLRAYVDIITMPGGGNNSQKGAGGIVSAIAFPNNPPTTSNGGPLTGGILGMVTGQAASAWEFDHYFGGDFSYNGMPTGACGPGLCFVAGTVYPAGSSHPIQNLIRDNQAHVYLGYNPDTKTLIASGWLAFQGFPVNTGPAGPQGPKGDPATPCIVLPYAAIIAVNWASASCQQVTLAGNATLTFTGQSSNGRYLLEITQDDMGSRTITWPAIRWQGGVAPNLTPTADRLDLFTFVYDGSQFLAQAALNF